MLTREERSLLRAKIRDVEEAIEDFRACLDPLATLTLTEIKQRGTIARHSIMELKRYCEEDLS